MESEVLRVTHDISNTLNQLQFLDVRGEGTRDARLRMSAGEAIAIPFDFWYWH